MSSTSDASTKPRRLHQRESGTERCGHTCQGRVCTNAKGSLEWVREGSSVSRHERSRQRHPRCTEICPRNDKLQLSRISNNSIRSASQREGSQQQGNTMDIDDDILPPRLNKRQRDTGPLTIRQAQLAPTRSYLILVVLEPSRSQKANPNSVENNTEWVATYLPKETAKGLLSNPGLHGFIFVDEEYNPSPNKDCMAVVMYEKLLMTQRWMKSDRIVVEYMAWGKFVEEVEEVEEDYLPNILSRYDLIWGGADLNLDLSQSVYRFKTKQSAEFHINQLRILSHHIVLWPPVDEILEASRKAKEIKILDQIAAQITRTVRPHSEIFKTPAERPTGVVLKREVSDTSRHIYLPNDIDKMTPTQLKRLAADRFVWVSQTYVPQLRQFGEWRIYFVGGRLFEIVTTELAETDQVTVDILQGVWSLQELTDLYFKNPRMTSAKAMAREGGSTRERRVARNELEAFATTTYNALISEQPNSSLSFICRLDIGVMMNSARNRFDYFVNEVERGNLVSIFGFLNGGAYLAQRFGDETREALIEFLDEELGEL